MGVQTYDEKLLSWLGRPAGAAAIEEADALLAERWSGRLSRDVLAGLPRDSGGLTADLRRALSDGPGHLSVYELTIEEGTPLVHDRKAIGMLPDEAEKDKEWHEAVDLLEQTGYRRYEVSNFSIPGEESIHNLGYWRLDPYLGIGPGAVSTLPGPQGPLRIQQVRQLTAWLAGWEATSEEETIVPVQFALETYMMALRTAEGLSKSRFENVFGETVENTVPRSLEKWERAGFLENTTDRIVPTPRGLDLVDAMLADIAAELDDVRFKDRPNWPPS
jgi:oxygen-independent coproporphyrinogen III oxidase